MREYTVTDLFRLTRAELLRLHTEIATALAALPGHVAGLPHRPHQPADHPPGAGTTEPYPPLSGGDTDFLTASRLEEILWQRGGATAHES